jgi:DNA-binding MarR family transcriptional regulator
MLERDIVVHVANTCLCLHTQRAARALARLFDHALKPFGLSNGQFSLLMALNRPDPPSIGHLAPFLAMDRTSLTAALKPLERRGLVRIIADKADRRSRLVHITADGVVLLEAALPTWQQTHADLDAGLIDDPTQALRPRLQTLTATAQELGSQPR